jgi:hypothetical protein
MFYIVLNVSIQSFVCLLLSSLYYSFGVVDCAFKHNKGNAVNHTQHLNGSNSLLGLNVVELWHNTNTKAWFVNASLVATEAWAYPKPRNVA